MATNRVPGSRRSLLEGADAGLFVEPPPEPGRTALTLDASPMVVIVATGDRLAHNTKAGGPNVCPDCCGTGRVGAEVCGYCGGTGRLENTVA